MAVGTRCADHVTPLYPQKSALTSPTGGGRSVGIVHVRTEATEFNFLVYHYLLDKALSSYLLLNTLTINRHTFNIHCHSHLIKSVKKKM